MRFERDSDFDRNTIWIRKISGFELFDM
jgi:hypothetical protein